MERGTTPTVPVPSRRVTGGAFPGRALPLPPCALSCVHTYRAGHAPWRTKMRDHVSHDRGVLAHRAAARRDTRPHRPEFRARGGPPARSRRGGLTRRGPQQADPGGCRRHPGVLGELAGEPGVVFQGGPVSLDSALGLAVIPGRKDPWAGAGCTARSAWSIWRPRRSCSRGRSVRCGSSCGYAGWGPGQLEAELREGAWYVVESEPGDVSSPRPERLWRAVLRRQRSELAMVATYPDDPSLN